MVRSLAQDLPPNPLLFRGGEESEPNPQFSSSDSRWHRRQMLGEALRLQADIGHRHHLPVEALGQRAHRVDRQGCPALAVSQAPVRIYIQAEAQCAGAGHAFCQ